MWATIGACRVVSWSAVAWSRRRASCSSPLAVFTTVLEPGESSFLLFSAVIAGCYALAALVTADGLPLAWRVALGSPAVVLFAWGVVLPIVL